LLSSSSLAVAGVNRPPSCVSRFLLWGLLVDCHLSEGHNSASTRSAAFAADLSSSLSAAPSAYRSDISIASRNVAAAGRVGAHLLSRSSPQGLLPFIGHLPFVASSAELSNDDATERRQCLLTLLVRQPAPKLLDHQQDRRARRGIGERRRTCGCPSGTSRA